MKHTINVLASDFENNSYNNAACDMSGCPLQRAYMRAGVVDLGEGYTLIFDPQEGITGQADDKVIQMFRGIIPIEDFSFEIEIP
jgi:hypothetical protein